jgi:predicted RNase H-like nuclease
VSRTLVGIDGCPDGWLGVVEDGSGDLRAFVRPDFAEVVASLPEDALLAIDVPIGLSESGPRICDREARALLGPPRASSVFPAPVRGVLGLPSYEEASEAHRRIDGRGMSRQAYGIAHKIGEVDAVLRSGPPALRERVVEVHPEVSFCLWNEGRAMRHAKKRPDGADERRALVASAWPGATERLTAQLDAAGRRYGADDLLDALAALWTARRVAAGTARTLPENPPSDRFGLPMRIVG